MRVAFRLRRVMFIAGICWYDAFAAAVRAHACVTWRARKKIRWRNEKRREERKGRKRKKEREGGAYRACTFTVSAEKYGGYAMTHEKKQRPRGSHPPRERRVRARRCNDPPRDVKAGLDERDVLFRERGLCGVFARNYDRN